MIVDNRKCTLEMVCETQGDEVQVSLNDVTFAIHFSCNQRRTVKVAIRHILAVQMSMEGNDLETERSILTVHYVSPGAQCTFVRRQVELTGDSEKCQLFHDKINDYLEDFSRPKRLLLFINPNSGKKKALKIFRKYAAPLFKICDIKTDMIVTSRPKQPTQKLQTCNMDGIDGIVTVGGDGLYCECMNGLLIRTQKDAGLNYDDPGVVLRKPKIPIGIIPAGSGDVIAQYLHGTRDVTTAVLKVLLGDIVDMNAVGVHEDNQLSAYSGLILGFGLFGDIMNDCEKYRWMGPARYNIVPLGTILKRRTVDIEFEYIPADSQGTIQTKRRHFHRQFSAPAPRERPSTPARQNSTPEYTRISVSLNSWKKTDGRVYGVDTYAVSLGPDSGKLVPHFGDDALSVIITDKCSLSKHVAQLSKLQQHKSDCYEFDFIRHFRVNRYRVRLTGAATKIDDEGRKILKEKYFLNCDGEVLQLTKPEFQVRLHQKIVPMFGKLTG